MLEVGYSELGGQRHHWVYHLQGPNQRKEEDISNITVKKRPNANTFIHLQFCCGPWGAILNPCSSHKLMTLWRRQKDVCWPASLLSFQWESFYSVTIMIWNTYFWCTWERKEGWIKYVKTAILALVDKYSRILHVKM